MRITILGRDLPGRRFTSDGVQLENVHVAVQVRKEPVGLVRGDEASARWEFDVKPVVGSDGALDVRGPAVHGKRGERFFYLTWGEVGPHGSFSMFRRAKLMVADIDPDVLARAVAADTGEPGETADAGRLVAELGLTDARGCPLCARVRPPNVTWSFRS